MIEPTRREGIDRRAMLRRGAVVTGAAVGTVAVASLVDPQAAFATTGDTLEGWYDVTSYGLVGDNTTDNTTPFRTLLATVVSNGGGTIYFPPGMWRFSGTQQNHPNGGNPGLINIPFVPLDTSHAEVTIEIVGATTPRGLGALFIADPPATSGAVLICETASTTSGGSSVNGNFFNCGNADWSWINLVMRNLAIRLSNGTTWNAVNAQWAASMVFENVNCDVNATDTAVAQPSAPTIGILTPANNNGAKTKLVNCGVIGYGYGYWLNEHSETDGLWALRCSTAYCIPDCHHGLQIGRLQSVWCTRVLEAKSIFGVGTAAVTGGPIDIEDAPTGAWYSPGTHVVDSSNVLHGDLSFVRVVSGVGKVLGPLTVTGGTHVALRNVEDGVFPLRNATWVPSSTLSGGGYLYIDGGALKFRGGSGTVTTIASA